MNALGKYFKLLAGLLLLSAGLAAAQEGEAAFEEEGIAALYLTEEGELVEFVDEDLVPGRFIFYAWLEDQEGGVSLTADVLRPPTDDERIEFAPSFTQNLLVGFVGYIDDEGLVHPVAGAQVRWMIDDGYADAIGSVMFGAVDAAGPAAVPNGLGVLSEDVAVTLTNNAYIYNAARFPIANDYPLYNATGLTTPDTNGATWVTLFSPDPRARARIVGVATVNGVEIGKEILVKNFAPAPELEIEKTVDVETVNLAGEEFAEVTFEVTVRNVGAGNAENVLLEDALTSGNAEAYELVAESLPGEAEPEADGFVHTFSLPAGEERVFTFRARATETDTYCNTAVVREFTDEFGEVREGLLEDQACFEVIRPELAIVKDFVDAEGVGIGDNVTVTTDQQALLRVRVINRGTGAAEGLLLSDELVEGDPAAYGIAELPEGVAAEGDDAFEAEIGVLEPEDSVVYTYPVIATEDGTYCDVAVLTANGEPVGEDRACLVVATPELTIEKVNEPEVVLPGGTYTSLITVANTGNAMAEDVLIADVIASNEADTVELAYVSSEFDNAAGVFVEAESRVEAPTMVDLPPGESITLAVTTRVPEGVAADVFCNLAVYESANAGDGQAEACVEVPAFAALQTRLIDEEDPVVAGSDLLYTGTIYNEPRSNEAIEGAIVAFTFGAAEGLAGGAFEVTETAVYLVEEPERNAETGALQAGPTDGVELVEGEDYTLGVGEGGEVIVELGFPIPPDTAVFVLQDVTIPEGVAGGSYDSSYQLTATGADSGTDYSPEAAEPTTVLAP